MSIIFISHKLNEVLEIADRITVLRRGKVDRDRSRERARPRRASRASWWGARSSSASRSRRRARARRAPGRRRPRSRRPRLETVRGVSLRGARRRDRRYRGRRRATASPSSSRPSPGLRKRESGTVRHGRDETTARTRAYARCSTRASVTSRRIASATGSSSTSRSPRTSRCTTTDDQPNSRFGWLFPRVLICARTQRLLQQFDVRGGGPQTQARTLSGGNQQKLVARP